MLVLTRAEGESIYLDVGGGIWLTVLSIKGKRVKVGLKAPDKVRISRGEIKPKDDKMNPNGL